MAAAWSSHVATTATLALQLWLRPDEPTLGWGHPGVTVSAYAQPFSTWASMPQLIPVEDWPDGDTPGTIAYFCGAFDAPWPPDRPTADYVDAPRDLGRETRRARFIGTRPPPSSPRARGRRRLPLGPALRWDGPPASPTRLAVHRANIDPSDRYVLCVPGSDQHRLRSDESGYDNLFLAGDWTDNGLNAGCIEAAVLSGLQAANGDPRSISRCHRITGMLPR